MGLHWRYIVTLIVILSSLVIITNCHLIYDTSSTDNDRLLVEDVIGSQNDISGEDDDIATRIKRSAGSGLVTIARFKSSDGIGKMFPAYVDDTMTRLIFRVAVSRSEPHISTVKPSGSPYTIQPTKNGTASQGTVVAILDIPITSSDYGFWKFTKNDATTWDVTILGESPVSITHELFGGGSVNPITKYPVIGKSYNVKITVAGMTNIKSADLGMLVSKDKIFPLTMEQLSPKGTNVFEMSNITMPAEPIMIGIQGKDKSGHPYKRLDDREVIPVTLKLYVPPYTGAMIEEHTTFNITFTVTNILSTAQDIDVRIEDDKGLAQSPKVISYPGLRPGDNFTGSFQFVAGNGDVTTLVRLQARQNRGGNTFTSGPIEWRNFTIFQQTTTPAPTTLSSSVPSTASSPAPTLLSLSSATVSPSSVTTLNSSNANVKLCDISRFTDASAAGKEFVVYVDSTIKSLKIKVTVTGTQPVLVLAAGPTNKTIQPTKSGRTSFLDIPITPADYGIWKVTKVTSGIWDVVIQAESPICVTSQFFELLSNVPLQGNPIQEKLYKMELTVQDMPDVASVDQGFLVLMKNMVPAGFVTFVHRGGNKYEAASVKTPTEVFLVSVQGKDKTGHTFRRIDSREYNPVSVKLDVPAFTDGTIMEHSTFIINSTVTSLLTTNQEIDIRISDDRHYSQAPTVLSLFMTPGETFTGNFTLRSDRAGLSTLVKIEVVRFLGGGKFGSGPEEVRNFTVVSNVISTQTPTANSKNSSSINMNGGNNQPGVQLNVQGNQQKGQNSLLLMLLSLCDTSNININL